MSNLLTVGSAYGIVASSDAGTPSSAALTPGSAPLTPGSAGLSPGPSPSSGVLTPSSVAPSETGQYGDPVLRVMEVLDVLMSELTDSGTRSEANRWLIDFQKSKESSGLVLGILYAALYPEKNPGAEVSQDILASIGRAQPAAQQQLLFFIAQTLAMKLRRSLSRPELSSDVGICDPQDLLMMARRALELPHYTLSQYLALSSGLMCIILIDQAKYITETVREIINKCIFAVNEDGTRFLNLPINPNVDILSYIIAKPSVEAMLAFEICTAFATGVHHVANNRMASPSLIVVLKEILLEIAIKIVNTQHESVHAFLTQLSLSEHANWTLLLKAALQRHSEFGDLTVTIFRAFFELYEALPNDTDIQSVCQILLVLVKMSTKILSILLEMITSGRLTVMIAQADNPSDLIEAITQASVNTIEQVHSALETLKATPSRLVNPKRQRQGRRSSDVNDAGKDWDANSQRLVKDSLRITDACYQIADVAQSCFKETGIIQLVQAALIRIRTARSIRCISLHADSTIANLNTCLQSFAASAFVDVETRKEEAAKSVGKFLQGDFEWTPLDRRNDARYYSATPQELLPQRKPKSSKHDTMEDMFYDLSACPNLSSRILILEEIVGGFCVGQFFRLIGQISKTLAPVTSSSILFGSATGPENATITDHQWAFLPKGSPNIQSSPLVIDAWLLAASADLSVSFAAVEEMAINFTKDSRRTLPVLGLLDTLCQLTLNPRTLCLPIQLDNIEDTFSKPLLLESCHAMENVTIVPENTELFEEIRGNDIAIGGIVAISHWLEKFIKICPAIWNDLGIQPDFANEVRSAIVLNILRITTYAANFEYLAPDARTELQSYRDNYRAVASRLVKLPLDSTKIVTAIKHAVFNAVIEPEDCYAPGWPSILQAAQRWKYIETLIVGLTVATPADSGTLASSIVSDHKFLRKVTTHRALLRSVVWLISQITAHKVRDENFRTVAFHLCRAALRLPQSDSIYPMSANEDHLGAVVLFRLARMVENMDLETLTPFGIWLCSSTGATTCQIQDLVSDFIWLSEESASRSLRRPPSASTRIRAGFSGAVCVASLASLSIIGYSAGAILCALETIPSLDGERLHRIHTLTIQEMMRIIESMLDEFTPGETLVAEAVAALIRSVNCLLVCSLPVRSRPGCKSITDIGIELPTIGWACAMEKLTKGRPPLYVSPAETQEVLRESFEISASRLASTFESVQPIFGNLAPRIAMLQTGSNDLQDALADMIGILTSLPGAPETAMCRELVLKCMDLGDTHVQYSSTPSRGVECMILGNGLRLAVHPHHEPARESLEFIWQLTNDLAARIITSAVEASGPGLLDNSLQHILRFQNILHILVCKNRVVPDQNLDGTGANSGAVVLLVVLSQILAAYALSGDTLLSESTIESAIPQAAINMCQSLASNFRLLRAPLAPMIPDALRESALKCLLTTCCALQMNIAQKRALRSSAGTKSPVPSPLPLPSVANLRPRGCSGLDQLSCGAWMFTASMILQAVMSDVSGVGKIPYENALDSVVEILTGGSLSVADLCSSCVMLMVGSLPVDWPGSPFKWAFSAENDTIFREELTKALSKGASPDMAKARRGSLPTFLTPLEVKTDNRTVRKVIRRHSMVVNVAKKRQR